MTTINQSSPPGETPAASSPPDAGLLAMSEAELERRLMVLHESFVTGKSRAELIALAQERWHISRRTAYRYMRKLQHRMARHAQQEGLGFVQQVGQLQRNRLLEHVYCAIDSLDLRTQEGIRGLNTLGGLASRLIDGRERTAKEAEETLRDSVAPAPTIRVTTQQNFTQAVLLPAGQVAACDTEGPALARGHDDGLICHNAFNANELSSLDSNETASQEVSQMSQDDTP